MVTNKKKSFSATYVTKHKGAKSYKAIHFKDIASILSMLISKHYKEGGHPKGEVVTSVHVDDETIIEIEGDIMKREFDKYLKLSVGHVNKYYKKIISLKLKN